MNMFSLDTLPHGCQAALASCHFEVIYINGEEQLGLLVDAVCNGCSELPTKGEISGHGSSEFLGRVVRVVDVPFKLVHPKPDSKVNFKLCFSNIGMLKNCKFDIIYCRLVSSAHLEKSYLKSSTQLVRRRRTS